MRSASIIIRTKNEERWLARVLDAISRQTWPDREVILVDSGSTDGTLEIARRFGAKIIEISFRSFTYGSSLNHGIREASGEYIVALSGHAIPIGESWLTLLLSPLQDPAIGAVYGRWLPLPDCDPFEANMIGRVFSTERRVQSADHTFSNANGAWRKQVWEVEPFDERLPAAEDQAWAASLLQRGLVIVYEPAALVYHSHNLGPRAVFLRRRATKAALKWIDGSTEHCNVAGLLWLWSQYTWRGWQTTWRSRSHWRWWLYCPIYHFALAYGYYRGLRDPLFSTYPHPPAKARISVST